MIRSNLRLQPKSLLRICMHILKANPEYINNDILPLELVDSLQAFITYKLNGRRCNYQDYILTTDHIISNSFYNYCDRGFINPRIHKVYDWCMPINVVLRILKAKKLSLCEKSCRRLKKAYSKLVPSVHTQVVVKIVNINPIVLKRILLKNYCIVISDVPKYYLSRVLG